MTDRAEETAAPNWGAPQGTPIPPAPQPPADDVGVVDRVKQAVTEIDDRLSQAELPFDSIRSGIIWWYRPFIEARTWTALGSLFVGVIWGPIMFSVALVVVSVTFSLSLVFIGLLLIVPAFGVLNALARVERRRAAWVGKPIASPHFAQSAGGFFSPIGARLTDGARWRQVLFFGLFLFVGPILFTVGFFPWGLLINAVLGFDINSGSFGTNDLGLFGFLGTVALAGAAPRFTMAVAWVGRAFTEALLGPTETVELQERVTELSGQRQQILDAVSGERRRIERNLHDGVQQQLVALGIDIGRASARLDNDPDGARELLDAAKEKVRGSIGELRLIGRGLNPAVLDDRGLDAALSAVVANSPIPISVSVTSQAALPDDVASTAYYVVSEAVANMLKHADARVGSIRVEDDPRIARCIRLVVHDDGRGGADSSSGTGLAGMRARVEGVDGIFDLDSPKGGPTRLVVVLPLDARPSGTGRPGAWE